jgi:1-deoxy-D-xylulose-5-phosphate reductoisomerase
MPIQYALTYPDRQSAATPRLDWSQERHWDFYPPDLQKFRLLHLAYQAQEQGGSATCTLNAADEIAVEAFLDRKIPFPAISEVVEETLSRQPNRKAATIEEVIEIDLDARSQAKHIVAQGRWASAGFRRS